ncbi:MAG: hypothetical protein NZ839_02840, partial [Endomicrobia bacterium]|nr:hypothetical protein [Endomicrobiia bacterium]
MRKYISECLLKDNDIEKLLRKIKKITWYCYIEKVINQLIKHKINFYFIGGMIRDLIIEILNKKKTNRKLNLQDVDIVVETGSFEYLMSIIKKVNFETKYKIIPHPEFLTISILLFPHQTTYRIDMSIVRKETYPSSGSLPVVSAGSIYEDLLRRDFTVNAIALKYECEKNKYTIFDPFNGIKDLINKKIRVLHDKSFVDDPTRIIRAIQYASRLKFRVEPKTTGLIKEAVNNKLLNRVSKNRLTNEFVNILQKGENLCLVSKMFKKYNIVEFYKFLHPI